MWRYAGLQRFEFENSSEELALVVGCDWRILGPDFFALGSWNFGRRGKRFDGHAEAFYEGLAQQPLAVNDYRLHFDGAITISLEAGFTLSVNPEVEVSKLGDQWRIMRPLSEGRHEHVVLQGSQLYVAIVDD